MHPKNRTFHAGMVLATALAMTACTRSNGVVHLGPPALTPSDPDYHLKSDRFTTHQPDVLEQIGAHHAYAKGLAGRGVRIGIHRLSVHPPYWHDLGIVRTPLTAQPIQVLTRGLSPRRRNRSYNKYSRLPKAS